MNDVLSSIAETASQNASRIALICENRTMRYRELEESTSELAESLQALGLSHGKRVAVHWSNSIETVQLYLACFKAGVIVVPVNTHLRISEIAYILGDSGACFCFSEPALAPLASEAARACGLPDVQTSLPMATGKHTSARESIAVDDDSACLILYTSGTTSPNPKGVVHTHRTVEAGARASAAFWDTTIETTLVMTSMMHVSACFGFLFPAMLSGTTAVLIPQFDPAVVLDAIERFRCTSMGGLPAMCQRLIMEQAARPRDLSSLRRAVTAGDTVSSDLQRHFAESFGLPLLEGFASTEIGFALANPPEDQRSGSFGKALAGYTPRIIDTNGAVLPTGETGELAIKSTANFIGYWNNPKATAEAFLDDWFLTGDLARLDEDGYFCFVGRKKQIIKRSGFGISPLEIERVLETHASVAEAGVVGLPDPAVGEQVIALITLERGCEFDELQIQKFARNLLADLKRPDRILLLRELPKNANGKLHRPTLKKIAAKRLQTPK